MIMSLSIYLVTGVVYLFFIATITFHLYSSWCVSFFPFRDDGDDNHHHTTAYRKTKKRSKGKKPKETNKQTKWKYRWVLVSSRHQQHQQQHVVCVYAAAYMLLWYAHGTIIWILKTYWEFVNERIQSYNLDCWARYTHTHRETKRSKSHS